MLALALVAALLVEAKTKLPRVEFDASTVAWSKERGTSRLYGQAFLKTRGGDVKTCAGNEVSLVPDSPYGRYRMQLWYGNLDRGLIGRDMTFAQLENVDPDFRAYVRTTICDAEGRFAFTRLPAGRYYIVAPVFWEAPTGWGGSGQIQGGNVMKAVDILEDDEKSAIVSW